jgi:hypothetical protein
VIFCYQFRSIPVTQENELSGNIASDTLNAPAYVATVLVPLEAQSLNKRDSHFMTRSKRVKKIRSETYLCLRSIKTKPVLPCTVMMCRLANSTGLDPHDNLPGSLKPFSDGVADWLGIDDRDPRITWKFSQRRGKLFGVEITVSADA